VLFRLIAMLAMSKLGQEILIDLYKKYVSTYPYPEKNRKDYR